VYGSPLTREVRRLVSLANEHAADLLREWEAKVKHDG
jgi:hypothetical protein